VNRIQLLPLGEVAVTLLDALQKGLAKEFSVPCEILPPEPDPSYAWNPRRQQHSSTEILAALTARQIPPDTRLLAVTPFDLFIPILTFVFGEAQLEGRCAVVSAFRLRQEFYGLPSNNELLASRLVKESAHELGHTLGIAHCDDYGCVMAPSHAVEWIDLKSMSLCESCRGLVQTR
jgi:archaemetzincin